MGIKKLAPPNLVTQMVGEIGSGFAGIDIEVEGAEHLTRNRPAVFIFNHQSMLDAMVLAHLLRRDAVAVCKKELATHPFTGALLRRANTLFVDRESANQSALLKESLDVLNSGRSLVISPEGTRSTLGEIQPFKHGAFYLAKKGGCAGSACGASQREGCLTQWRPADTSDYDKGNGPAPNGTGPDGRRTQGL